MTKTIKMNNRMEAACSAAFFDLWKLGTISVRYSTLPVLGAVSMIVVDLNQNMKHQAAIP